VRSCGHGIAGQRGYSTRRLTSSQLIGRSAELRELEAALTDVAGGTSSLAFLSGESGVGKTRLLMELQRRAQDRGALVLTGDAIDLGTESTLPYLPLIAALRPLARAGDPALSGPLLEAVSPLLPGLVAAVPDPRSSATEDGQQRLFEGLLSLLDALGRERPVLLVIEDLHWADRSTRAALSFLARSMSTERVLLVGSYRSDELYRRHPLRPLLAELEREPRARRIALLPFTLDEFAEQLADILGAAPAPELVERLWTRSGGNALFGEELLAADRDGHGAAPDSLRDALMLRVERLSEPAQELLRLVAVAERLDHPLLENASGLDRRALRDALREAVDRNLLVAQADGMYRFRHALLREVIVDDLLPGERSDLHLALARVLELRVEEAPDAQVVAAVAHHFAAAGDSSAALRSAVRAATAAERVHAHEETVMLLEHALELWDRVPDPDALAGADRVTLLLRASEAAAALGKPGRQLALLEVALDDLGPQPDPLRAASMLEAMARAQRHLNRAAASIATLERALALVEEGGATENPSVRPGLLAALARALMIAGRVADAVGVAQDALQAATAAGMPLVEGDARNTLGFSMAVTGAVEEGAAELREAIRIAREHRSYADVALAYLNYADVLHMFGRSAEARSVAEEGRRAVEGIRPVAVTWFDATLAGLAFDVGDWEAAEAHLPTAKRWTGEQTRMGLMLRRAALAAGRGQLGVANELLVQLEPMAAQSSEPQLLAPLAVLVAEVRCREGELDAARAAVERGLERIGSCGEDAIRAAVAAAGVSVEADAAQRARDLHDEEAAATALRRLDELLSRVAAAATPERPVERAALMSARAEASRAAGTPDPMTYGRAAAAWQEVGRAEPTARMRWRQAEALVAAGEREAATEAARAAREIAVRVGAGWLRAEIEGLAARARIALDPDAGAERAPEPADDAFGLTSRERQVLALLAEGATNREIGATLFMAEKTASVHVSRILVKLNARSRTEAATVAHRHRLLQPHT
jgi:ATP/maltotriose-dependent transcriptional regulator MalT